MSRRTLRGAVPATDSFSDSATEPGPVTDPSGPIPTVPVTPAGGRPGPPPIDSDAILLRGADAARAQPLDLVGVVAPGDLGAVGPWAEQLDAEREAARTSGLQQGRQEGLAAGMEAARQQNQSQRESLAAAIQTTVADVGARSEEVGQRLASQVAELAVEVARAVLDREIAASDDPGAEAIARCLDLVPDAGALAVRLNPGDAEALGDVPGLGDRSLTITPDPSLSPGDAIVSVDQITIDARVGESLRRIAEALR